MNQKFSSADKHYEVINAGIAGSGTAAKAKLLTYLADTHDLDMAIIYTGLNDLINACTPANQTEKTSYRLPQVALPKWSLLYDLMLKNTVYLRTASAKTVLQNMPQVKSSEAEIDTAPYSLGIANIFNILSQHNLQAIFILNSKAFRPDQPIATQMELSGFVLLF